MRIYQKCKNWPKPSQGAPGGSCSTPHTTQINQFEMSPAHRDSFSNKGLKSPHGYHLNFTISSLSGLAKHGRGIIDKFLLQPHHFFVEPVPTLEEHCLVLWLFWSKTHMCVVVDQWYMYYSEVNISLLGRFTKPGMGILDNFLLQPCKFTLSQCPFWREKKRHVLWLVWPQRYMCMIVDWYYTTWTSILAHYQGPWSMGEGS